MNRIRARLASASTGDEGITMIEIVIYLVLSGVVAGLVLSMTLSTLRGQDTVTAITDASARGQAIAQGLDRALRNAKGVAMTTDADGNAVLAVFTTLPQACQAWRVTTDGTLQASSGAGFTRWGDLAERVEQVDGQPYFGWSGQQLRYGFALGTGGQPVNIEGAVLPRGTNGSLGTSCS